MAVTINARGTSAGFFQVGKKGPIIKNNSGVLEFKNAADNAFVEIKGSTGSGSDSFVTRSYVDSQITGLDIKQSVRVATTVALSGGTYTVGNDNGSEGATPWTALGSSLSIDGITLSDGDRVLVKNETTNATGNGIFVVGGTGSAVTLSRAADADNSPNNEVSGSLFTFVEEGSTNAGTGWVMTSPTGTATLGTDALIFGKFSSSTAPVSSVFGRTGEIVAVSGDYSASQITNTPSGYISSSTVQAAINELATSLLRKNASDTYTTGTLTFGAGTELDLSTNDVYLNSRVIRNAVGGTDDGLYLGFGNANSGNTKLYGGGSSSTHVIIGSTTISPSADSTISLGTSTEKWSNTFSDSIILGTATTANYSATVGADGSGHSIVQLVNATTGTTASDGSYIGVLSGTSDMRIWNQESASILIGTNGTTRATISNTNITTTVPILAPSGSASAPSIAFSDATGNGFYSGPFNLTLGFAMNGTARWSFDLDGNMDALGSQNITNLGSLTATSVSSGTVTASSTMIISGTQIEQTNASGLQLNSSHASGGVYIRINGSERMRIDNSGNVGVGSSSIPSNVRLQVIGTNRPLATDDTANLMVGVSDTATDNYGGSIGFQHNGSSGVMIAAIKAGRQAGTTGGGYLSFATRTDAAFSTERMRITSEGYVTVATSTPTTGMMLTVNGAAQFGQSADGIVLENGSGAFGVSNAAYLRRNSSSGDLEIYASSSASRNLIFGSSSGAEDVRIDSSGNVGIGTTAPTSLLHLQSSATPYLQFTDSGSGGGSTDGALIGLASSTEFRLNMQETGSMTFYTAGSERARITPSGSLLVGTTTESYPWYFNKSVASGVPALTVENPDNTGGAAIRVHAQTSTQYIAKLTAAAAGAIIQVGAESNHPVVFIQNDTERMRIDTSGLVGIQTSSPSSYDSSAYSLVVGNGAGNRGVTIHSSSGGAGAIHFAQGSTGSDSYRGFFSYNHTSDYLRVGVAATEQARFDSNGLRIGTTAEVVTAPGGELVSLQGTASKTALSIKHSTQPGIQSWNTGDSSAIRYHFIGWNPAGNQEIHLRRETDASISLTSNQAKLNLSGAGDGIDILSNMRMNDYTLTTPILKDYAETSTSPSSSSNAITLDIGNGNSFQVTLTENVTTVTISNPTASGSMCTITVRIVQGAGPYTITWPASFKWPGGTAGTLSTGSGDVDILTATTWDGGTTWNAVLVNDFS